MVFSDMESSFVFHHFTLSVRDIRQSATFYRIFGFKPVLRWAAPDESLVIVHLSRTDGLILELFKYASNGDLPPSALTTGNDLDQVGIKHVAFRVPDIQTAARELKAMNCGEMTDVQHGRTGIDYFFIADPDGNWVEVAQDDRDLRPDGSIISS